MSGPGHPTLDQLRVLVTVAEAGSFAAAARRLNRATSVVSYTIAQLEGQLGLTLFDRQATRKPQLTQAGRVVLVEARIFTGAVDALRAKVKGMLAGLEGELHVVLDCLLPGERVVDALTAFEAEFPTVRLHLHVETLGAVADLVLTGVASLGVSGPFAREFDALRRVGVGSFRMVPVAGPGHALARPPPGGLLPGDGRRHTQLVISDRSQLTAGRDFSVTGSRTWRLADIAAKHMLLKAGIGWGMMPWWMVSEDVRAGRLVQLDMPDQVAFDYLLDAIYRTDTPPGPAGRPAASCTRPDTPRGASRCSDRSDGSRAQTIPVS